MAPTAQPLPPLPIETLSTLSNGSSENPPWEVRSRHRRQWRNKKKSQSRSYVLSRLFTASYIAPDRARDSFDGTIPVF